MKDEKLYIAAPAIYQMKDFAIRQRISLNKIVFIDDPMKLRGLAMGSISLHVINAAEIKNYGKIKEMCRVRGFKIVATQ